MIPVTVFKDKAIAIFGLGLSGIAAALALRAGGAEVAAWDDAEAARKQAHEAGIRMVDLATADWSAFTALVLAPGVPLTHPEPHWTVSKAKEAGIEIIGDTELFFRERGAQGSKARVIAITGTNGKSTTAALTAHVLKQAGVPTSLGGNIGTAVLDLEPLNDERVYVIEFSSYQIDLTPGLKANAAALLNITPDHLDRHGSLANYASVKARIFSGLDEGGVAVIGVDDEHCRKIADGLSAPFSVCRVSVEVPLADGIYFADGSLVEARDGKTQQSVTITGVSSLRGLHNAQNAATTFALALSLGLEADVIAEGFKTFPGLEHRMQEVGRLGRVLFINDSKGTNADAAAHALASFNDIHWIAGGLAKSGGVEGLEGFFSRITRAYLIGEAAEDFALTLEGKVDTVLCGTLDKAVAKAAQDAAQSNAPEPAVLLSPACASFDQYPSFMARGDAFCEAVARVAGVTMLAEVAA